MCTFALDSRNAPSRRGQYVNTVPERGVLGRRRDEGLHIERCLLAREPDTFSDFLKKVKRCVTLQGPVCYYKWKRRVRFAHEERAGRGAPLKTT